MAQIRVMVQNLLAARDHKVELPDDIVVERLLLVLPLRLGLPAVSPSGEPLDYVLFHREHQLQLTSHQTLEQAGVKDGDTLMLAQSFNHN